MFKQFLNKDPAVIAQTETYDTDTITPCFLQQVKAKRGGRTS
jgi:hypothetical protein